MKKKSRKSEFNYIRAHVADDGEVEFFWRLKASARVSGVSHDENVASWEDEEIARLAKQMAGAEGDPIEVEVIRG